ncbi:MAG TPA: glycosyltransferase [Acidimicrobiales bacterium]|nr:glycosyltransferase [Acidimicrobiales bacterium]
MREDHLGRGRDEGWPSVSVVMPTSGRRERLPAVVAPLLAEAAVSQLVVVVDGCDDGSMEWLADLAASEPRLLAVWREHPGGAQVARADGLERATGDVVLFLDDDVLACPGLAEGHAAHHARTRGLVVVGYMPVRLPARRLPGQFATYLYAQEYEGRCRAYDGDADEVLRTLWWGNVSLRRADAQRVGLVAPGLEGVYHEDRDFGLRCRQAGLRAVFDRSLRAEHLHQRDVEGFVRDAWSQGMGRVLVHERHAEVTGPLVARAFGEGLPPGLRWLVSLARWPRAARAELSVLAAALRLAGALRLFALETAAGRVARRVAQRAGAEAAWRGEVADPAMRARPVPAKGHRFLDRVGQLR